MQLLRRRAGDMQAQRGVGWGLRGPQGTGMGPSISGPDGRASAGAFSRCVQQEPGSRCPAAPGGASTPSHALDLFPQIRRRRPTPATLVLTSDQSSPEIDEDRIPNPLLKSTLSMSPRQRKKVTRTTPTMKELQMMVEHHLGQQQQGDEPEGAAGSSGPREPCPPGIPDAEAACRPGAGKAAGPAEPTREAQERGREKPGSEEPTAHIPPPASQGAKPQV
uniref:Protein phosphatase 1 regulatory subunit 1A n=1 Tax=Canis lupus familiaris TaxID=9615 RepID=A0A8P0T199_CANLF